MKSAENSGSAAALAAAGKPIVGRADDLMIQSERCLRLADNIGDPETAATLRSMAKEYEAEASCCRA